MMFFSESAPPAGGGGGSALQGRVNFNGTGTLAIREEENVSSVADGGTGSYTVNWDIDFANANYTVTLGKAYQASGNSLIMMVPATQAVGSVSLFSVESSIASDSTIVCVMAAGVQ